MVTQEQDIPAIASDIKRILEEETGNKYVLKSRAELVHPDDLSWYLHLPIGTPLGWIDHAQQEGDSTLAFVSMYLYDAHKVIEFEYRQALKLSSLRTDAGRLQVKAVRDRYAHTLPKVVKFFDKADELLGAINRNLGAHMTLLNSGGLVSVRAEISLDSARKNQSLVRKNIQAVKDFVRQTVDWQNEQRAKSAHMAQIKRTHHRLLDETTKQITS
jgi:hypothetical protein